MLKILGFVLIAVGFIVGVNGARTTLPAMGALQSDRSHGDMSFLVTYAYLVDPYDLSIDLRSVSGSTSMVDVDRELMLLAEHFRQREFNTVYLKYRGKTKFFLIGETFREIGSSYNLATNPLEILMKLPSQLYTPAGNVAFSSWTGGWLGVMQKQLEDHKSFHQQWYADTL